MRLEYRRPAIITLLIVIAAIFVGFKFSHRSPIDTDILSLLPASQSNPALADALSRLNDVASNRVAILIEGSTPAVRNKAVAELTSTLVSEGIFLPNSADGRALWDWLFAHRSSLVCPADRKLLVDGQGLALAHDALSRWYSPFGISNSALLKSDPMLLTPRLMACLLGQYAIAGQMSNASLISGSITSSAFRTDVQDRFNTVITNWQKHWSGAGLSMYRAGAVFHAAYGAESARWQMSLISTATILLILLIYVLVFGTIRPAFVAILLIGSCLAIGLAVILAIFSQIHVMVIVFATALIGMVVDYSTYYLITGVADPAESVEHRRTTIFRPLTLGMATSVGAFGALLFAPIPAFRQIAILGGVGLFFAWVTALYLLPHVEGKIRPRTRSADWAQRRVNRILAVTPKVLAIGAIVTLSAVLFVGAWIKGGTLDDVRKFQAPSIALASQEAHVRAVTGFTASGSFFLVTGRSSDEEKVHEEALLARIDSLKLKIKIVAIAASPFDPSQATADLQRDMLRDRLLDPYLSTLMSQLNTNSANAYKGSALSEPTLPRLVSSLRGQTKEVYWSIVPLAVSLAEVPPTLGNGPFWTLVDPADAYSRLLAQYRLIATFGLAGGALITGLILLLVYRQFSALWILLPTTLAMITTPSILALLGLPYSFFSAMGLFLVIGAGVDYSIFQWEHGGSRGHWTRLGITLAALMTCTSLGLLGFSSVLPVASFGVTVALGIFLSLILSPIASFGRVSQSESQKTSDHV